MSTVEEITTAIDRLPADQFALVHAWVVDRAERGWDARIEADEKAGRLDARIDKALAEHTAGRIQTGYSEARAARGSREAYERVLAKVPDVDPVPGDER